MELIPRCPYCNQALSYFDSVEDHRHTPTQKIPLYICENEDCDQGGGVMRIVGIKFEIEEGDPTGTYI